MLLNITVENFRSYDEAQTLSLVASDSEAVSPEVNSVKIGEYYVRKSAVIYGANASGKSNIIKAVIALINILNNGISPSNQFAINQVYHPFFNNKEPIRINIDFSINDDIYTYSIGYDDNRVYSENLLNYDDKVIFARKLKENSYEYEIPDPGLILSDEQQKSGLLEQIKLSTSEKMTFLSQAVLTFNSKKLEPLLSTIRTIWLVRLNSYSIIGKPIFADNDILYAAERFKAVHGSLINSLNSIGVNLKDLEVNLNSNSPMPGERYGTIRKMTSVYNINGNEQRLDFLQDESDGTVKFYSYLALIDFIVQNDGILFVDELETHFHPLLVEEIIRAVHNSDSKAQLIFTTHNPVLLDESIFERDQIYFTEKNDKQATEIYSLVDFSDLEELPNLTAKYMAGRLGAVPYINSLSFRKRNNDQK